MTNEWDSQSSEIYRQLAAVAVPFRAEQIATLLTLIPHRRDASFRVVELASGEGFLSHAILTAFPHAAVLALDGEATMRRQTAERLAAFGLRASVDAFDMLKPDWYSLVENRDVVVSSLCIHHLTGVEKQALFGAVYRATMPDGALLIADVVQPQRPEAREVFAAQWERLAQAQAHALGVDAAYDRFVEERWNYYRYPDPMDKPSGLFEQLEWLKAAGFASVDCFWLHGGHAIYGGYKQPGIPGSGDGFVGVPYEEALHIARMVLGE